jgi:rhodanese-related sulfurtransferase
MSPSTRHSGVFLDRLPRRAEPQRTPRPVAREPGLFVVDATWGSIAPMSLAPGLRTVGELEVLARLRSGGSLVDCRQPRYYAQGTLPGALNIPHDHMHARRHELHDNRPTALFCNGPQCTATPQAVQALLAGGHPAAALLYYRGGIHDWVTLGLPLEDPRARSATARRPHRPAARTRPANSRAR